MSKLSGLTAQIPQEYDRQAISNIFRAIFQQLDGISEGKVAGNYGALNATPSGSVTSYAVSDTLNDSNATVGASLAPGVPLQYVRTGWIWNVAGNPGTFQETRVPNGLTSTVPAKCVWAAPSAGTGLPTFRTLTTADIPGSSAFSITPNITSLGSTVTMNNTSNYFDGPSQSVVAGAGVYFASGTITVRAVSAATVMRVKLWDGTTVISSTYFDTTGLTVDVVPVSLSGYIVNPAGNIRISVRDTGGTASLITPDHSGNGKDSTLTTLKIG